MAALKDFLNLLQDKETKVLIQEKSAAKAPSQAGKEIGKEEATTLLDKIPASQILANAKPELLLRDVDSFSFSTLLPTGIGAVLKIFLKK
jgi:hypothetical protein